MYAAIHRSLYTVLDNELLSHLGARWAGWRSRYLCRIVLASFSSTILCIDKSFHPLGITVIATSKLMGMYDLVSTTSEPVPHVPYQLTDVNRKVLNTRT